MKYFQSISIIIIALTIIIMATELSATKYGNVTIEESVIPGGYELSINTKDNLVLTAHNSSQGKIIFEVANYSSPGIIYHKMKKIPFIESVTIERSTENLTKIELKMSADISYEYSPVILDKSLKIKFEGEILISTANDYFENGEKHRLAGNKPAALESYRMAIRLADGRYPAAYFGIGSIRKELNHYKLAIGSFKNTLTDEEFKRAAHSYLSQLFEKIGKEELSRIHQLLSEEDNVDSVKNVNMFLAAKPAEVSSDPIKEIPGQNTQHADISLGSIKTIMLILILLSPFALLLLVGWNSAKRAKKRSNKENFKEELEETLKLNNLSLGETEKESSSTERVETVMNADRFLFGKVTDEPIRTSITKGIMDKRHTMNKIRKLIEQNYTTKQVAQDLYMSESEVKIILGIDSSALNIIENRHSPLGRISESPLKSKELSRELHRDEEELKLELIVHEHLNE